MIFSIFFFDFFFFFYFFKVANEKPIKKTTSDFTSTGNKKLDGTSDAALAKSEGIAKIKSPHFKVDNGIPFFPGGRVNLRIFAAWWTWIIMIGVYYFYFYYWSVEENGQGSSKEKEGVYGVGGNYAGGGNGGGGASGSL